AVSQKPLRIGEWHHLAGVVDRAGGKTHVYINGALDGTSSWPAGGASRPFGKTPWRIGYAGPGWKEWAWPGKGGSGWDACSSSPSGPQRRARWTGWLKESGGWWWPR
ncbi:MAG: hypothetical protein HY783_06260, partial [Chloroflexi bacterium]|nr:hypothetical protein [Chloroflexota bacterium]